MPTTPYMSLLLPTVSVTLGTTWAEENNDAFTTVDSHDHTSGKGVQVPTGGININADLDFNSYNAIGLRSTRFDAQVSAIAEVTDIGCLYVAGVDLYYNDGNGNQIQLTAGGALNAASIGGIGGDYSTSSASVFYTSASKTFSFWQDTNKSALMDCGTILLRRVDNTSGAAITIKPDTSLVSSYTLTLPIAVPGSQSFVSIDASGNLSYTNSLVSLTLSGALSAASATISGASSFLGAITLGTPGVTPTAITFDGRVASDVLPTTASLYRLGTSILGWKYVGVSNNIGTTTPDSNALYADLIPKAWAATTSGGSLSAGVNLTVTSPSTGVYTYTFRTALASGNFAAVANSHSGTVICYITGKSTTGFTLTCRLVSDQSLINQAHGVIVMGTQ